MTFLITWLDIEGIPRQAERDDKSEAEAFVDWLRGSGRRFVEVEVCEK